MQSHTLNKNEYLHEKSYTLYSAIPLPPCGVTGDEGKVKTSPFCGVPYILLLASWESISDDCCDPAGDIGRRVPVSISAIVALTWKETFLDCIVYSEKLTFHMKTFSKSLVISFGMKPTGFPAIDVSIDFLMRR
jgi:hypothetical protein